MEGEKKRKVYDREFKLSAVRLIVKEGRSVASVARDLGVNENSLHHWKKQFEKEGNGAFPGKGHQTPEEEELRQLRRELAVVREERDILKKAIAFFAKHGK